MNQIFTLFLVFFVSFLSGCDQPRAPSADQQQRQQQEALAKQSNMTAGMPAIVNFQEKKLLKNIYELRDTAFLSYTYIRDLNGKLHKVCDSVGYGIPYSTQYTNPQRISEHWNAHGYTALTLPQADPNGLFSPGSAEGTWVMCKDPKGGKVQPVYIEDRVTVSPFELSSN